MHGAKTALATHGKTTASKAQTDHGTAGTMTPGTATGGKVGEIGAAVTDGAGHSQTGTTESAPHVDVQRDGWQWSYQLDEAIMRSSRGRPYYKSRKSGKFLCAIQCTATHCNHMRPACNFSIRDPENDNHGGHLCSYCRQDLEWRKKKKHGARPD